MKITIISSMWCSACLVMKNIFNELKSKYDVEYLDYDLDEERVEGYNIGKIIPVLIIEKDGEEITRIIGEKSKEEIFNEIEKYL